MKAALVYDRINKWGGAERVLLALHEIWPEAPLFTSVYNPKTAPWAKVFPKVIPSFLQNFPLAQSNNEIYPLLMPMAFESLNFDEYEVVISITSEAAKGIVTKPSQFHLCYCLTPIRYLWSGYKEYFDNEQLRCLTRFPVAYLRKWDKVAAQRPDEYIAISRTVQARITNYYHCKSEVIYPPVDTDKFEIRNPKSETCLAGRQANSKFKIPAFTKASAGKQNSKYFLVVSRLVKYKKVDLVIEAFNQLGWNLKIVGVGREMGNLQRMAKRNIEFLGQLTDEELLSYYQNCKAVIFPTEEDLGIVPLETMACGKPVIAFKGGGATETVIEGATGEFFTKQNRAELISKLRNFKVEKYEAESCRKQAEKFSKERFKKEFKKFVEEKWQKHIKITSML